MDWQIDETDLKYLERLGGGSSGEVHHVIWKKKDGSQCDAAAKKFKKSNKKKDAKSQTKELNLLRKLRHPNIVEFFCAVLSPVTIIVTEFAKNGSLFEYLQKQASLPLNQVYDWALQASEAIQYIHDRDVLHRDIKSGNFVIDKDNILKLCDFGISKNVVKTVCTDFELGTIPWMAPETFVELKLTKASDVYSLGILIWELLSCKIPYANRGFANIIWSVQIHKLRPDIPPSCPPALRQLLLQCWNEDASKRPTAGDVVNAIKNMQQNLKDVQHQQVSSPSKIPTHARSHGDVAINIPESSERVIPGRIQGPSKSVGINQDHESTGNCGCNKDYMSIPVGLPPKFQYQYSKPSKDCVINFSADQSNKPGAANSGPTYIVIHPDQILHQDKGRHRCQTVLKYLQILSCLVVLGLVVCLLLHCGSGILLSGASDLT